MDDSINMNKMQLVALIDPHRKNEKLLEKSCDELSKILFKLCTSKLTYKLNDYDLKNNHVVEYLMKKELALVEKELKLSMKEEELNDKEDNILAKQKEMHYRMMDFENKIKKGMEDIKKQQKEIPLAKLITKNVRPNNMDDVLRQSEKTYDEENKKRNNSSDEDYVRKPDKPVVNCLIPENKNKDIEKVLKMSQESFYEENKKRSKEKEEKEEKLTEEEEFNLAIQKSIEELDKLTIPLELLEVPNYQKIISLNKEFTKEMIDEMFILIKDEKFTEFKEYVNNLPLTLTSLIWKFSFDSSKLKQMVMSKNPIAYKCFI